MPVNIKLCSRGGDHKSGGESGSTVASTRGSCGCARPTSNGEGDAGEAEGGIGNADGERHRWDDLELGCLLELRVESLEDDRGVLVIVEAPVLTRARDDFSVSKTSLVEYDSEREDLDLDCGGCKKASRRSWVGGGRHRIWRCGGRDKRESGSRWGGWKRLGGGSWFACDDVGYGVLVVLELIVSAGMGMVDGDVEDRMVEAEVEVPVERGSSLDDTKDELGTAEKVGAVVVVVNKSSHKDPSHSKNSWYRHHQADGSSAWGFASCVEARAYLKSVATTAKDVKEVVVRCGCTVVVKLRTESRWDPTSAPQPETQIARLSEEERRCSTVGFDRVTVLQVGDTSARTTDVFCQTNPPIIDEMTVAFRFLWSPGAL
ncbi:hypothetical protein BD410DRAFT_804479 [Rickenella mellea]|uniref:Uncharacterized protein n=1 Tax=Rickenella mellea TaxID=50990 RepID=A0A4Y7Q0W2_9AGAM|nr:hypothetical protein BD410DRAFT_804479 [Rickenella mellea]